MSLQVYDLNKFLDALKEVGNIGAGKASGLLSRMVGQKVIFNAPEILLTKTKKLPKIIGSPQELIVGVHSQMQGDVNGALLIVLRTEAAMQLADLMQKKKIGSSQALDSRRREKLKNIGDALAKSYVTSITDFLDINVVRSEERIVSTFGESLPDLFMFGIQEKNALFITTDFEILKTPIKGKFITLMAIDSTSKILRAIKKQLK